MLPQKKLVVKLTLDSLKVPIFRKKFKDFIMTIKDFIKNFRCEFTIDKKEDRCLSLKTEVTRRRDNLFIENVYTTYNFTAVNHYSKIENKELIDQPMTWENIIEIGRREHLNYIGHRANIENFNPLDLEYD